MNDPRFSVEDLSRLKTIDRCLAHADKKRIAVMRTLSSKQVRFLRELVERLSGADTEGDQPTPPQEKP